MSIKTVATFAIIIGCFAVLYPKFLHPMMTRLFGLQSKSAHDNKDAGSQYYPPGRRPDERRPPHMPPPQAGDMRQHMRPGPHPGMRAAAEMHRQQAQHGSGRGMMGIVLPMYAVGIVLYLVYTLVKVFGKKDKSLQSGGDYQTSLSDYPNPPASVMPQTPQEKTKELQNLLLKADDKSISNEEMKELQRRLEETEAQMSNILKAMQLVQNKIQPEPSQHTETQKEKKGKSPDSSPDMESYEVVTKVGKTDEQQADISSSKKDVDNVVAEEVETKQTTPGPVQDAEGKETTGSPQGVEESDRSRTDTSDSRQSGKCRVVEDEEVGDNAEGGGGVADDQEETSDVTEEQDKEELVDVSEDHCSDLGSNVRHRQVPPQSPH